MKLFAVLFTALPSLALGNTIRALSPDGVAPCDYVDTLYWENLTSLEKEAAAVLGYGQGVWDLDGRTIADELDWAELSSEQQNAASVFGFEDSTWGTCA